MTLSKIHYAKPSITQKEIDYATDAATNGWGENCLLYLNKFSEALKSYLGVPHVIPTSSCTGALHMGMAALGIGPGDEVIAPDVTWVASVAPVKYLGATPVLVDVLEDTWCIDPSKIEAAITPRTKAILAVHLYGNLCEMDEIKRIADKHNLFIVEDAAEAMGSVYKGRRAGSMGDISTFSFHGTKTMTTGEGGALIIQSDEVNRKARVLDNHGRDMRVPKQFWCETIGLKYRMCNVAAAIGVAQLERIDELVTRKRTIFNMYRDKLADIPGLALNPEKADTFNSYWMTTAIFPKGIGFSREKLMKQFAENNIDARVFFYPLSMMPPFEDCPENTVSLDIYERGMNLPCYHDITEADIDRVCSVIRANLMEQAA